MFTQNYIKICEKAEEIQELWKDKKSHIDDKVYVKHSEQFLFITEEIEFYNDEETDKEYIVFKKEKLLPIPFTKFNKEIFYQYDDGELNVVYLPTQEQLQDMIDYDWYGIFKEFYWWFGDADTEKYTSMNELWLAFVIKKKWNKIWDGDNWIKEVK